MFSLMIFHNWGFWLSLTIIILYGLYRFLVTKGFTWIEFSVFIAASFITSFLGYLLLFSSATDVRDIEIHSGFVNSAKYEEGYTYEYWTTETYSCGTDSKGNTKTCTRMVRKTSYRPPQWSIETDVGGQWISSGQYNGYFKFWQNEYLIGTRHSDQVSFGDGKTYMVKYPGVLAKRIYANVENSYINYVKGSFKTILKNQGVMPRYQDKLVNYPNPYDSGFGNINLNRVIVSPGTKVPQEWVNNFNWNINILNGELGASKQVSFIVILTDQDEGYVQGMKEYWRNGKKNDVEIYVGCKNFPTIDWVNVHAWTDREDFKIDLRNALMEIKTLDRGTDLLNQINKLTVSKFKRKSMKEYEYLLSDITLPWWAQLIVFIVQGAGAFFLAKFFEEEDPFGTEHQRGYRNMYY